METQMTKRLTNTGLGDVPPQRILFLPVQKKWFDLLRSGYKKEEYRSLSDYWVMRLLECTYPFEWIDEDEKKVHLKNMVHDLRAGHPWEDVLKNYHCTIKPWDVVRFRNGYGTKVPQLDIKFESISIAKPQQGLAPKESLNDLTFVIHLEDIVSGTNLKAC